MLSLYKLEIFNAVAMEGSFSKAAQRLLLTQPAVSQHIRDLEVSLHVELFERGNRGVKLTSAGETLLDYTRCILRMLAEAEEAVRGVQDVAEGVLSVGATPGPAIYLLPAWIQSFHARFPGVTVSLNTDTTGVVASDLLAQRAELGFVEGEQEVAFPLNSLPLREIRLYLVVGLQHPWREHGSVPIEALGGQPFVTRPPGSQTRQWIEQVFNRYGVTPRVVAEFDHPEAIRQAVASGLGVTILPEWGLENGDSRLMALSIEGVKLQRTLRLMWNESVPLKPAARAFLSTLTETFPQLAQIAISSSQPFPILPERGNYKASLSCKPAS